MEEENNTGGTIPSAMFLSLACASFLGLLNCRWCCHLMGWGMTSQVLVLVPVEVSLFVSDFAGTPACQVSWF